MISKIVEVELLRFSNFNRIIERQNRNIKNDFCTNSKIDLNNY